MNKDPLLSLAGIWSFQLDPGNCGESGGWFSGALPDTISLPGTTDEHQKGEENPAREPHHLTRIYPYVGAAFYQRELTIPERCTGKSLFLRIERTKHSTVWVDNTRIGEEDSLCTPHVYEVTDALSPGTHRITVRIDNSNLPPVGDGHQTSAHTQTNWNGLLGAVDILVKDPCFIEDLQAYPDCSARQVRFRLKCNSACTCTLTVSASSNAVRTHEISQRFQALTTDQDGMAEVTVNMGESMQLWDHFNPVLYRFDVTLHTADGMDRRRIMLGMRDFSTKGTQFQVNGRSIFLRGKNDCCVFPLTGYAPMDVSEWKRVMGITKSYGINHIRFHSWCPPGAAFEAADELGIYLQPELPVWEFLGECTVDPMGDVEFRGSGDNSVLDERIRYLTREGLRILNEYGNHPSFCMFALGNELSGDVQLMASMVRRFRQADPRHLYTQGSNNFIREPLPGPSDDYWTTMMTGGHYLAGDFKADSCGKQVRGSFSDASHGHVNGKFPGTRTDYTEALQGIGIPVIGHEVGQYQVFPSFAEIPKYTGVLRARNLEIFREKLEKAGMRHLANAFFSASGQASVICYREEIEAALRTPGFAGFQLLDLQDFPGQGTALVGILDAFMDSKGLITPEAWREFCDDVVLLARFEKYTWTRDEAFAVDLCVADYGAVPVGPAPLHWSLNQADGKVIASGQVIPTGEDANPVPYGKVEVSLAGVTCPQRLALLLWMEKPALRNSYPIWVYPSDDNLTRESDTVHTSRYLDRQTLDVMESGGTVLLCPGNEAFADAIPGSFQTDFWCYPMFKKYNPPGTMGILCDPEHPALAAFPTESHSNWQWWRLLKKGCAMILDDLPADLQPIVRVIDNFDRNHRLGVLFECRVGEGRLMVCSCDLLGQQVLPEARQLLISLRHYMTSDSFTPPSELPVSALKQVVPGTPRIKAPARGP